MAENDTLSLRWSYQNCILTEWLTKGTKAIFWGPNCWDNWKRILLVQDLKWERFFISGTERLKKLWAKLLTLAATKSMTSSSWEIGANIWTKILWVTSLATLFQNGDRDALSEGRPRTGSEREAGEERGERDQRRPGVWYPRAAQQVTGVYMNEYMNEYMNIRDYFSFGFAHHMLNAVVKRKSVVIYLGLSRREWDLAGQGVKPYLGFSCGA